MARSEPLATFPASTPGYAQLDTQQFAGQIEVTFMFRTAQPRGLLLYMVDTPSQFNYVSVANHDGDIVLSVFPEYTLTTSKDAVASNAMTTATTTVSNGGKTIKYNDDKWHTVSFVITNSSILLVVDDYESARYVLT